MKIGHRANQTARLVCLALRSRQTMNGMTLTSLLYLMAIYLNCQPPIHLIHFQNADSGQYQQAPMCLILKSRLLSSYMRNRQFLLTIATYTFFAVVFFAVALAAGAALTAVFFVALATVFDAVFFIAYFP